MSGVGGRLEGKTALITGATSGMGVDVVRRFVAEGAKVVFCGRSEGAGQAVAAEIGPGAHYIRADVSREDEVATLVAGAKAELQVVLEALQTLPEIDRAALLMRAEDGMPYEEIASALGVSPVAARVKVHRARLKLAKARRTCGPALAEEETGS